MFVKEIKGTDLILNICFNKIQKEQRSDITSKGKFCYNKSNNHIAIDFSEAESTAVDQHDIILL